MGVIVLKLSPILLAFCLGAVLKKLGVAAPRHADILVRGAFYVALPALIFVAVTNAEVSARLALLPLAAGLVMLTTFAASALIRPLAGERRTLGVARVGSMIMNTSFIYPFVIVFLGEDGLARTAMFDLGNGLLVFTFVYFIATRHGEAGAGPHQALRKLVSAPPVWALTIGLALNAGGLTISGPLFSILKSVGLLSVPLIMAALGVYFSPRLVRPRLLASIIAVRSGVGLACGVLLGMIFDLDDLSRHIVALCAAAPVGYNTLTFAAVARLDVDFAASLVSTSMLLGIVYVPLLIFALS